MDRASVVAAEYRAGMHRSAVLSGFLSNSSARIFPEISFPWNLLGYPASANSGSVPAHNRHGNLRALVCSGSVSMRCLSGQPRRTRSSLKNRLQVHGHRRGDSACIAMLIGPRLVPQAQAHHFARAVQLNFPEVAFVPQRLVSVACRGARGSQANQPRAVRRQTGPAGMAGSARAFFVSGFAICQARLETGD